MTISAPVLEIDVLVLGLFVLLVESFYERIDRRSLAFTAIFGLATVLAVVMVLTNLYYFRVWVFAPIRELQAGVQRVHRGNFDLLLNCWFQSRLNVGASLANGFCPGWFKCRGVMDRYFF